MNERNNNNADQQNNSCLKVTHFNIHLGHRPSNHLQNQPPKIRHHASFQILLPVERYRPYEQHAPTRRCAVRADAILK